MARTAQAMARAAADELGCECISVGNRLSAIGRAMNDGRPVNRRRLGLLAVAAITELAVLATHAKVAGAGAEWDPGAD